MTINYNHWLASKETIADIKTKKETQVVKQKRENITATVQELDLKLKKDLSRIFDHERNIVHQYQAIKEKKKSLTEIEAMIHMDGKLQYEIQCRKTVFSFRGFSYTTVTSHSSCVFKGI
jgi:hypothetical protein